MFAFGEPVKDIVADTLDAAAAPVLQTRTPTGKSCGPTAGLLLSSPITFHVSGVTENVVAAFADAAATRSAPRTTDARSFGLRERTVVFIGSSRSGEWSW